MTESTTHFSCSQLPWCFNGSGQLAVSCPEDFAPHEPHIETFSDPSWLASFREVFLPTIFAPLKSHLEQTEKGPTKTTTMLNVNRNINSRITRKLQSGPAQRLWYGVFLRAWIHSSMSKNLGGDQKSAARHLEWLKHAESQKAVYSPGHKHCWCEQVRRSKSSKLYVYVFYRISTTTTTTTRHRIEGSAESSLWINQDSMIHQTSRNIQNGCSKLVN